MKLFKFFKDNNLTSYDGEWSQMAIRVVVEYVAGRFRSGQSISTEDAQYVIAEVTYQHGELAGAVVKVFPIRDANIRVTYWISMGRVTPFITDHSIVYNEEV
jgi:hypothetical protein